MGRYVLFQLKQTKAYGPVGLVLRQTETYGPECFVLKQTQDYGPVCFILRQTALPGPYASCGPISFGFIRVQELSFVLKQDKPRTISFGLS